MKLINFLFAFILPLLAYSQNTEGEITYVETVKLQLEFGDGPEAEEMKKMIPPSQSFPKTLYFNANASLYQDKAGTEEEGQLDLSGQSGGGDFQIKIQRPDNKLYRNIAEGTTLESREFFGRYFLITDKAKAPAWKITGEQKKMMGFVCQKATVQLDSATAVEAWFTPQIPVSTGPSVNAGLPGLILELNMNGDQRTIVATQVEFKSLPKDALVKPSKGKEMTNEEFKVLEAEKMKEMGMEMGSGGAPGTMKMIIRN
ncbi:MAG: GLPGLI family protein [Saprospiraceae bacterium]|nr:GLPGLI family protein [Saprospiraceae bacterium]MCF8251294.1 GLPGLI family protein [Saprospiraceae bacterium]MCF8280815.1 GLPGLI family protein [Bacteroidales bacterium]MCF8311831.1 GLPGLI family protein [Saprospiraceae bacterium]MCF8441972.1 GLPGLI family protein [Saprospiraceae bacterium]